MGVMGNLSNELTVFGITQITHYTHYLFSVAYFFAHFGEHAGAVCLRFAGALG